MKQSELRIGNYVWDSTDNVIQVRSINSPIYISNASPTIECNGIHYYLYYYKPIPLTEEWLHKFGFEIEEKWDSKAGKNFLQHDKEVVISLSHHYGNHIYLLNAIHNPSPRYMIEYVHELQNVYHILTGQNLDIINC